jgi:hypothetical protein
VKVTRVFSSAISVAAAVFLLGVASACPRDAESAPQSHAEKAPEKIQEKTQDKPVATPSPKIPAQIELLETRIRFESNGDSRKEVHALVKINDELGVRQFARLNFDFNRSFEQIEIPLARITHPSGGVVDILPGAITDTPNPAVVNAPAYQDVRVKSVRILGLEPGDSLEYRVITTVSHHPLSPDFWLDHNFDRTGVVSHEIFELDLPAARQPAIQIDPATPATTKEDSGSEGARRIVYRWQRAIAGDRPEKEAKTSKPDVVVTTFPDWDSLSVRLAEALYPLKAQWERGVTYPEITQEAKALTQSAKSMREKLETIYSFVAEKVATVDLPIGATGFAGRSPVEILGSRYATAEDKYVLFNALSTAADNDPGGPHFFVGAELAGAPEDAENQPPRPTPFTHLLIGMALGDDNSVYWLDPSLEVAPFNMVSSNYRGKVALFVARKAPKMDVVSEPWEKIPDRLPFAPSQRVSIDASLASDGSLNAKIHYRLRDDNELVLRLAFHQSPKEKWNEVAQLLALSDGFRGKISKTTVSNPYETHDPFTVEFEMAQPKFVDWSKKPLRVPALLPLLGLPDPPAKSAPGAATRIDLGTPLDVELSATVHLPAGTIAHIPTGTSVARDFATYTSQYSAKDATVTASRHLNFILKEIPADRAADYNAFLRAVQNDESQTFTLERADTTPAAPKKP